MAWNRGTADVRSTEVSALPDAAADLRGQFAPLADGTAYLDCAATALVPDCVLDAQRAYDNSVRANIARGVHRWAERATEAYEGARRATAEFLCSEPSQVVFTGGATAALNMLALSVSSGLRRGDVIVASRAEHHSNLVPWQLAARRSGARLELLEVGADGAPDLDGLAALARRGQLRVLALTHASNVTGAPTDLELARELADEHGCVLIADGAQMMPHGPFGIPPPADFYVFSGHKCHGPTGIGVLWSRSGARDSCEPPFAGGGAVADVTGYAAGWQRGPRCWEAGTPPISQAVGLAAALGWLARLDRVAVFERLRGLAVGLMRGLARIPGAALVGAPPDLPGRLPLVSLKLAGCHPHDVCQVLAEDGVAVRGGHHCAQPLIAALGLGAEGCVRASFGPHNNERDVERLLGGLARAAQMLS